MPSSTVISANHAPILIVAAGRSGTKMLRSILASHPSVAAFPREINYIWRHGNARWPTDELAPNHARPEVVHYIRSRFEKFGRHHHAGCVVEKTCANSLRLDFVHTCFPEAYIIHLIRDGHAVAESARRRWTAKMEPGYLLEKARWLPTSDIAYYAYRYLKYRSNRWCRKEQALSSWGPRFTGLDQLVKEKSLIEVCGLQWQACVEAANTSLQKLPPSQAVTIHYEDLVNNPVDVAENLFEQVQLTFEPECKAYVEETITQIHLEKWRFGVSDDELVLLNEQIGTTLQKYGCQV